jgi:hypothetical protein
MALLFQTVECGVKSAHNGLAIGTLRNDLANSYSVRFVFKAENGEKDHLFEFTELD